MRKPSAIVAAALLVLALALAGCASHGAGSIPAPASTATAATTSPATATGRATPSPSCALSCGGEAQYNGPAALPVPSWAPGDRAAALGAAVAVMGAYIRPATDHTTWFTGIRPRVTDQFAAELGKFDPTYLAVSKMTGPATATIDAMDSFQLDVSVPTDDGAYQVTMLRSTQTAPWLANSIIPPLPGDK